MCVAPGRRPDRTERQSRAAKPPPSASPSWPPAPRRRDRRPWPTPSPMCIGPAAGGDCSQRLQGPLAGPDRAAWSSFRLCELARTAVAASGRCLLAPGPTALDRRGARDAGPWRRPPPSAPDITVGRSQPHRRSARRSWRCAGRSSTATLRGQAAGERGSPRRPSAPTVSRGHPPGRLRRHPGGAHAPGRRRAAHARRPASCGGLGSVGNTCHVSAGLIAWPPMGRPLATTSSTTGGVCPVARRMPLDTELGLFDWA